jgi:uncharacterized Zn finger protein
MAPDEPGSFPFYGSSRRRPADGIKARSQRGSIGQSWWSSRFIAVLESFTLEGRLARGRSYARSGQVLELGIETGRVTALVQGSRARPYRVGIQLKPLSGKDWERVERALAERALFLAMLLAGEMPAEIEETFEGCRLSLFPASQRELVTACTCPDWGNPCKHVAAAYYILAEKFDEDPFLIFEWRGRSKQELIRSLRSRRGGDRSGPASQPATAELDEFLGDFWKLQADLSKLRIAPQAADAPDALLHELGPLPEEAGSAELGPAYLAMARWAEKRASR